MRLSSFVADGFPVAPIPPAPIRSFRWSILQVSSFGRCSRIGSDHPRRRWVAARALTDRLRADRCRIGADHPRRWISGIVFTEVSLSSQRRRITEQVAAVKPYILGFLGCTRFVFGYSFGGVVWPTDRAGRAQTFWPHLAHALGFGKRSQTIRLIGIAVY